MTSQAHSRPDVVASDLARDAMSPENQRVRPARQEKVTSPFETMVRRLDGKPSVHEMMTAYSPI